MSDPGRRVARIGEERQTFLRAGLVELGEAALRQIYLAPDLQALRRVTLEALGDRADRAGILGDVVALHAVAARGGVLQRAIFVEKRNRDTVNLRFDDHRNLTPGQDLLDASVKLRDLVFGIGVVQTEHRDAVANLREFVQWRAADAPGWESRP